MIVFEITILLSVFIPLIHSWSFRWVTTLPQSPELVGQVEIIHLKYCGIEPRLNWLFRILQNNMQFPAKFIPHESLYSETCL